MATRHVRDKTAWLFYSENGFNETQKASIKANGIMYSTGARLTAYETDLGD